MKRRLTFIVPA